jgi:DNA mismatch repair protein MutS
MRFYERAGCLELDAVSVRNLELVEPLFSGESAQTTLFHTLDACCTPMGKRLLRATLLRPASDLGEIEARLDAVAEAAGDLRPAGGGAACDGWGAGSGAAAGRVALDSAGPREVMAGGDAGVLPGCGRRWAFKARRWRELGGS